MSKKRALVTIPKVGEVEWRWSRSPVVNGQMPKSYRIRRDPSGKWWISFAVVPEQIKGPGDGSVLGVDRGVSHAFALNTGELIDLPTLSASEERKALRLKRDIARGQKGSRRRDHKKRALARINHRAINRRKDQIEKLTTRLASEFEVIHLEDLKIANMTRSAKGTIEEPGTNVRQKAGLNRAILDSGWGLFAQRIEDKVGKHRIGWVNPAYTSQCCSVCGHTTKANRKSQAVFLCQACGHQDNADVNAACNIAAGHAVTARGGQCARGNSGHPAKREPQQPPL